ncbi:MAG: hypothetical protein Q4F97_00720 [Bacteroidales bacterium]|nr:hypothetical protein [Bacteroidales bacterium]
MSNEKLTILWTSGEKDVAAKVVLKYAEEIVEHKLWNEIEVIVWGPSVKLLCDDNAVKTKVEKLIYQGVEFSACIVCTDDYGVANILTQMGVRLEMVGEKLTHLIQDQKPLISF